MFSDNIEGHILYIKNALIMYAYVYIILYDGYVRFVHVSIFYLKYVLYNNIWWTTLQACDEKKHPRKEIWKIFGTVVVYRKSWHERLKTCAK